MIDFYDIYAAVAMFLCIFGTKTNQPKIFWLLLCIFCLLPFLGIV